MKPLTPPPSYTRYYPTGPEPGPLAAMEFGPGPGALPRRNPPHAEDFPMLAKLLRHALRILLDWLRRKI